MVTIRLVLLASPLLLLRVQHAFLLPSSFVNSDQIQNDNPTYTKSLSNDSDGGSTIDGIFRQAMTVTTNTATILGDAASEQYDSEEIQSGNEVFVGVYYYPWHANDFHRGDGYLRDQLKNRQPPLLGEYDDRQRDIIAQHLMWSRRPNVRLWVCSWWGPNSREDLTIRNNRLTHPDLGFHKNQITKSHSSTKYRAEV